LVAVFAASCAQTSAAASRLRDEINHGFSVGFSVGQEQDADEHLGDWTTSQGKSLAAIDVYTSARNINGRIYALLAT
jgi:hypothetical protein